MALVKPTPNQPARSPRTSEPDRARVEPQTKELMGLFRPASLLPSWSRSVRANPSGGYLSALKGRGMEYDESRPYQAGDDFRTLDWRVTARTGKPHTKVFREERERPVYICADLSPTMAFATQGVFKSVQAARAATLLAWKAQQSGDRIGGVIFSAKAHQELPPERGKPAVIRFIKHLVEAGSFDPAAAAPAAHQKFAEAVSRLKRMAKPGSLIFVASDFRNLGESTEANLVHLARHNDVTLIVISDPFESALPVASGTGRVTDGGGDLTIQFGEDRTREKYAASHADRIARIKALCRDYRMLCAEMSTTDDPVTVLQRLLSR